MNQSFKKKQRVEEHWGEDFSTDEERRLIIVFMEEDIQNTKTELKEATEENWAEDFKLEEKKEAIQFKDVNPKAKLKFAKRILLCLFLLFIAVVVVTYLFPKNPQVERVWSYTSAGIYSIAGILIGYYFTSNK